MVEPFIHLSESDAMHYAERWKNGSVAYEEERGTHAFFVARVPYIPYFLTPDFTRTLTGIEAGRVALITRRQIRFVSDLLNARTLAEGAVAFDLRFIVRPGPEGRQGRVEIVFVGKVFHQEQGTAKRLCRELWRKFASHYPLEDPFNYPIEPVGEAEIDAYLQPIVPVPAPHQVRELRKFEDFDPYAGTEANAIGYFPHAWTPTFDVTALGRFIQTLAAQPQACVVSICLQPTALWTEELQAINQSLANYGRMYSSVEAQGWLHTYRKERFEDIHRTFWPLINARKHLFKVKIQVIGAEEAPNDVLEALGSELIENGFTDEPRQWDRETPSNSEESSIAWHNFLYLEQRPWGREQLGGAMRRLRSLVTAREATGAFRLPIPPEGGYLPGLEVRDEPFVLPRSSTLVPAQGARYVKLGEIVHRGQRTGEFYYIPLLDVNRHGLIGGATGAGKTNTGIHLLAEGWKEHRIPFLVIYPIDKPDYRILMADANIRDDLLIFTVADNTSPLTFNPFAVPDGIPLRTHMSLLMRCFSAAFWLWDPLPAIYREAIRAVYRAKGWDVNNSVGGAANPDAPTMAEFYEVLVTVANEMTEEYGPEVQGNIRQGSEIRIRDLLTNIGSVVNTTVASPIAEVLRKPTVIELGRVGSVEDTALIMGFLLMLISEQLQSNIRLLPREQRNELAHVTLVEEGHRLMASQQAGSGDFTADPRAKGGEDFSNLLAEVRGFGEGVLIAEQMPSKLVQGAVGNTHLKLMHLLEDPASFELFCEILNLDERQRVYAHRLQRGDVIVRGPTGQPVHVRVANYLDQFQDSADRTLVDDSDQAVRAFMGGRFQASPVQPWEPPSLPAHPVASYPPLAELYSRYSSRPECAPVLALEPAALAARLAEVGAAADQGKWEEVKTLCCRHLEGWGIAPVGDAPIFLLILMAALPDSSGKAVYERFESCRAAIRHFPQ